MLVGIVKGGCPDFIDLELLDDQDVVLVVVAQIEVGGSELTVFGDNQYDIIALEFAQVLPATVVVESENVVIKPNLTSAQGGSAFLFEGDTVYVVFRKDVTHGLTPLDGYFTEVFIKLKFLDAGAWFEGNPDDFSFPIGIGAEIHHPGAG